MTTVQDYPKLPALYDHCVCVYAAMYDKMDARVVQGIEAEVYEGSVTKLFRELGLSVPYYSNVMKELRRMQCITQLRRGGGGSPSIWILNREPSPTLWNDTFMSRPVSASKAAQAEQMLNDLNRRLTKLEKIVLTQQEAV